jgi:hypothetical protein
LNPNEWDETAQKLAATFKTSTSRPLNGRDGSPSRPLDPVGDYQVLPVGKLSSLQEDETRYYAIAILNKTANRLKLATVSWLKEPLEPWLARVGNQVAGGVSAPAAIYTLPVISEGGCTDDTWTAAPPSARGGHTAVWTGSEMIVWSGQNGGSVFLNTGGRYNPSTDTWTATNVANAPDARTSHTAVWTGSEMIVWGGIDENFIELNTGGRYNPGTDSWAATSTASAPDGRNAHTAVWSGTDCLGGLGRGHLL